MPLIHCQITLTVYILSLPSPPLSERQGIVTLAVMLCVCVRHAAYNAAKRLNDGLHAALVSAAILVLILLTYSSRDYMSFGCIMVFCINYTAAWFNWNRRPVTVC